MTIDFTRTQRYTWLMLGLWAVLLVAYWLYGRQPSYKLRVYQTPAGWGYEVRQGNTLVIHQPIMPGVAGQKGFANEAHARRVGERVLRKLAHGEFPPTLRPEDLY